MNRSSDALPTSAFDYALPEAQIAAFPAQRRDESRLLVVDRNTGELQHHIFRDIESLIPPGDALVVNETRVFPARLLGRRASGAEAEVLLLHPEASDWGSTDWIALVRPGNKLKPGRFVEFDEHLRIEILDTLPDGNRRVRLHTELPIEAAIHRYGRMPLPPYIDRAADVVDTERYQTVFARSEGSVAAPTAGLHFTPELLAALEEKGVAIVRIVLHVGVGTFRPVEVENPAEHVMHEEMFEVSQEAAQQINAVRESGGSIWAVGTTVTRTLESVASGDGIVHPGNGSTRLFIRPGYTFKAVDHLITNFHLPRSTLLMLVAAFGGYDNVMAAYRSAVEQGYRFYSYGDAMLLL